MKSLVPRVAPVAALVALVVAAALPARAWGEPVRLSFDKVAVAPGVWEGTVSGDVEGDLTTQLLSLQVTGPIWHVEFNWVVDAGPSSFTARLKGVLNTETGTVVMNGTVIEGLLLGAQVHEEGQLLDPATLRFVGSIRIMPATSG